MRLSELAQRLGGELRGEDREFIGFTTDSREDQAGRVFLAIRGARVDGHDYAAQVLSAGAAAVVCERPVEGTHIQVSSLVEGLAAFGRSMRAEFQGPVLGITGSTGKTTTKELAAAALSPLGPVLKTRGNRNTEYTSPLVWFEADGDEASAVIEMGMRGLGQIEHLASISQPTVGLITVIGTGHIEMVGSREGICQAKTELFRALPPEGPCLFWAEDDFAGPLRQEAAGRPVMTFGFSPEADMRVVGARTEAEDRSRVLLAWQGRQAEAVIPMVGRHQALNAAAAALAAVACGADFEAAVAGLESVEAPPMRMEMRRVNGALFVVDTYNANPDSACASLRALMELPGQRRRAVLGEMKELGDFGRTGHQMVGRLAAELGLDEILFVGSAMEAGYEEALRAGCPSERAEMIAEVDLDRVRAWLEKSGEGDVVLIKGSRALGLEGAVPA
jgi:UDP-N-acetylmuramoyl-tripeptide--D-alanyl-D-alanine ligase